ncbi:MAG: hypothetical protein CL908_24615 [Deltaproteobacteria bacterium]|nr:hypothetical protein [Deltaproteobacteria bacterium]
MTVLLMSLKTGLPGTTPAMGAMFTTVGLMGWTGIPMQAFILLLGCIALGLAVDGPGAALHFHRAVSGLPGLQPGHA